MTTDSTLSRALLQLMIGLITDDSDRVRRSLARNDVSDIPGDLKIEFPYLPTLVKERNPS